eukprot:g51821.t1
MLAHTAGPHHRRQYGAVEPEEYFAPQQPAQCCHLGHVALSLNVWLRKASRWELLLISLFAFATLSHFVLYQLNTNSHLPASFFAPSSSAHDNNLPKDITTSFYGITAQEAAFFETLPSPFTQSIPRALNVRFDDTNCQGNPNYYGYYPGYPACAKRVNETLRSFQAASPYSLARLEWQNQGVDGSYCSILDYLYKTEQRICPPSWQMPLNTAPIKGVNLGGWLVLEPWLTPSRFAQFNDPKDLILPLDEWHFCQRLGRAEATRQLTQHWDTWVTEADIQALAVAGINHVRIPVGYWILDNIAPAEPWIAGGYAYLARAIEWCKKYRIAVMIDLHTAPGSQNGYGNSGDLDKLGPDELPHWVDSTVLPNGTVVRSNIERTLRIVEDLMKKLQYEPTVVAFELMNEISTKIPAEIVRDYYVKEIVRDYYVKGYNIVRKYRPDMAVVIGVTVFGDCINNISSCWSSAANPNLWPWSTPSLMGLPSTYTNVWLDAHIYHIFSRDEMQQLSFRAHLQLTCKSLRAQLQESLYPIIVGEWSLATTDCAFWLNGYKQGARYDGQYDGNWALGPCRGYSDINNQTVWTKEYKDFLYGFAEVQMVNR